MPPQHASGEAPAVQQVQHTNRARAASCHWLQGTEEWQGRCHGKDGCWPSSAAGLQG